MSGLIRTETLFEKLEEFIEYNSFDIYKEEPFINLSWETIENIIGTIPTVDVKTVVLGKWNIGSKPRCSVCGKSALREYDRDDWLSYVPFNFCPHCGAYMKGE